MIIVEDGSIVAGANSFVSLVDMKSYLTVRGITPPSDEQIEIYTIFATDYLRAKLATMEGDELGQMPFPRSTASGVPSNAVRVQNALIAEQSRGAVLFPSQSSTSSSGQRIKSEVIGPFKTEYYDSASSEASSESPSFEYIETMIASLLRTLSKSGFSLTTVRI